MTPCFPPRARAGRGVTPRVLVSSCASFRVDDAAPAAAGHAGADYTSTKNGKVGDLGSQLPPLPTGTVWESGSNVQPSVAKKGGVRGSSSQILSAYTDRPAPALLVLVANTPHETRVQCNQHTRAPRTCHRKRQILSMRNRRNRPTCADFWLGSVSSTVPE